VNKFKVSVFIMNTNGLRSFTRKWIFTVFCLLLPLFFTFHSFAQTLAKEQVKAIYLYNFIKHIQWPNENKKPFYLIATYNNPEFFTELNRTLARKKVKGKPIKIIDITDVDQAKKADLLYLAEIHNSQLPTLANQIRSSQTLIVTNDSNDQHDVMINLLFNKKSLRISFEVNRSNIVYEKLTISPELLLLGGTEIDVAILYRATVKAMQSAKKQEMEQRKTLIDQTHEIVKTQKKIADVNNKLTQSAKELSHYKNEFSTIKRDVAQKNKELNEQESALNKVLVKLANAQTSLVEQQNKFVESKRMYYEKIESNAKILKQQQENINNQKVKFDAQTHELVGNKQTISAQKSQIVWSILFVILSTLVVVFVIYMLIKNNKINKKLSETIEHLHKTQGQLIESEKMASLGALVAGVAHEINTPLGIAVTSTSLIAEKTEIIAAKLMDKTLRQQDLSAFIDVVKKSSQISNTGLERVIVLLSNFKQVAADQIIEEAREVNLAHYTEEVFTTLVGELKTKKTHYTIVGEKDMMIMTIPGAFAQVLTNLVTNSVRHGFENRTDGLITIEINSHGNDHIKFMYHDNGKGIKPEYLDKVFDPFFTTKRNNGGTGLGMNIVYNIISQKLCGEISIDSTPEQGTTFTLILPKQLK
jgi:signal transduction histidine kinase